jgi:hypothetical protein
MSKLEQLKSHLQSGQVYRRAQLSRWSKAIDRHLVALMEDGTLKKLSGGVYYCPKKTAFGDAPPEDHQLVKAFLKDERFLLMSPNAYNALGVSTTQLYKHTMVYNHKRHGEFTLGGRVFDFRMKPYFPEMASSEYLLVDLVNNLKQLAEEQESVLTKVAKKAANYDPAHFVQVVREYGSIRAKKYFAQSLGMEGIEYGTA